MTLDDIREEIGRMQDENLEAWETCGNIVEMPYFEGFNDACEKALDLIGGRETGDG